MIRTLITAALIVGVAIPVQAQYYDQAAGRYACQRAHELRPSCNRGYYCEAYEAARQDCYNYQHLPHYYNQYPYNNYYGYPYYNR